MAKRTELCKVVSLGGSVVNPAGLDIGRLKQLLSIFNAFKGVLGIVVGGGRYAREYANTIKKLGGSDFDADLIAIQETKQNAFLVLSGLNDVYPKVLDDFVEARTAIRNYSRVVMGGTIPGITTDSDAVLLAEAIGAKELINISNVDGVYTKDPSKKGAKKFSKLSYKGMLKLAMTYDKRRAGTNFVFDVVALKLAMRSNIKLHFISYKKTDVVNALNGKKHRGTVVYSF